MTTTSWNRSSKIGLALLVVIAAAVVPAVAVEVGDSTVPEQGQVGEQVEVTVTLTTLYQDPALEQWELRGSTELESPTWTVAYFDQTDSKIGQESFGGQTFENASVAASDDVAEVRVTLTGTIPEVSEYTYDPRPSFETITLSQVPPGGGENEIVSESTIHFTSESQSARQAIANAETAVADAGEPSDASETLGQAIQAYERENFELATELAGDAQDEAEAVQNTQNRNQLLLLGGGVLLALALIGGGVWYFRQQRQGPDRLG